MILLIDNYDSFSYNLYQAIGAINPDVRVIKNDEMSVDEIQSLNPDCIVISPGPGRPANAGCCIEAIKRLYFKTPILGICLGHQAIFEAFGGTVGYADRLMHGKQSEVAIDTDCPLFAGLPQTIPVARYHSLAGVRETLPLRLKVIAESDTGEVMGVCHTEFPVYGLQFHPESILTPQGETIIKNFFKIF